MQAKQQEISEGKEDLGKQRKRLLRNYKSTMKRK
jgi:hypothetical protein